MVAAYTHLFAPIALGARRSRNRIMRAATTCNLADRGRVSERQVAFYRTVAKGGAGVVVSEALLAYPSARTGPGFLQVSNRDVVPGLLKLSKAVREEGALLIGQINNGGRQHHLSNFPTMSAPSAIACPKSGGIPHEMSQVEIESMIEHFVASAVNVMEGGFDGVEIHGAQGHLVGQFLSPFSNRRTDNYGGTFDNRLRFAKSILHRVRQSIGENAILGFRMCVEEFTPGGFSIEDSIALAQTLSDERLVDYISLSQGNFNSIETHLPDRHFPPLAFLSLHERIKKSTAGVPIVSCNHIKTPEEAENILACNQADMVGLCRPLLVDPDWPKKAAQGRANDIRKCIACNECWLVGGPIRCTTNPRAGRELELDAVPPPKTALRIVVVGGGPGGLEAARNAASRGHNVVLLEREAELGGKVRLAARAPNFEDLGNAIHYLVRQVRNSTVEVRLLARGDVQSIMREAPDVVIIATGAAVVAPAVDGDGSVPIIASADPTQLPDGPGRVVIMDEDGHYWAAAAAESAAAMGKKPIVVTRFFEPFRELPVVCRITTLRSLDLQGGETRTTKYVDRVEDGQVILRHYYSGLEERLSDCAAVVWVGRQSTRDELVCGLQNAGVDQIHVIGDAYQPRRLKDAIHEGHNVTNRL